MLTKPLQQSVLAVAVLGLCAAAEYIHLNPARAGLAAGRNGPLVGYK